MRASFRPLLAGCFLVVLLVLAGCVAPASPDTSDASSGLGSVGIRNADNAPHSVDVLVERNRSVVYWTSRDVDAAANDSLGSAVVAAGRFTDAPGRYVIRVRLDNQTTGYSYALDSAGCAVVQVRVEPDGSVTFAAAPGAYECRNTTA